MNESNKSPEFRAVLNSFTSKAFGRPRSEAIAAGMCVTCGHSAKHFKDALSRKEYTISGMCQICQNEVFGG